MWTQLVSWYGVSAKRAFPRKCIRNGVVELYPALCTLIFGCRVKKCFISCQARLDEVVYLLNTRMKKLVEESFALKAQQRLKEKKAAYAKE